jgi:hypothetical protein
MSALTDDLNEAKSRARDYRALIACGWSASVAAAVISDPNARKRFFAERDGLRDPFTGRNAGRQIERSALANAPTLKRRRRRGAR